MAAVVDSTRAGSSALTTTRDRVGREARGLGDLDVVAVGLDGREVGDQLLRLRVQVDSRVEADGDRRAVGRPAALGGDGSSGSWCRLRPGCWSGRAPRSGRRAGSVSACAASSSTAADVAPAGGAMRDLEDLLGAGVDELGRQERRERGRRDEQDARTRRRRRGVVHLLRRTALMVACRRGPRTSSSARRSRRRRA